MKLSSIHAIRLHRFMNLFGINRFKIFLANSKIIRAQVGWPDDGSDEYEEAEEVQDIVWHIQDCESMDDALTLGEFIRDNKLISIDKVIVDYEILQSKINWESKKFDAALNTLISIRVSRLDNGEETDSFFIHF